MFCMILFGEIRYVQDEFNEFMRGKKLTKDIIIHTIAFPSDAEGKPDQIAIVAYYPDEGW